MTDDQDFQQSIDRFIRECQDVMNMADPMVDQLFAGFREVFRNFGYTEISSSEARFAAVMLSFSLLIPREVVTALSAYLVTLVKSPS